MSIQSEITRLNTNVTNALSAISGKGVTVPADANSDSLAGLIEQIEAGTSSDYYTLQNGVLAITPGV